MIGLVVKNLYFCLPNESQGIHYCVILKYIINTGTKSQMINAGNKKACCWTCCWASSTHLTSTQTAS